MSKRDFYLEITNQIISDLEKGVKSWTQPWQAGGSSALPRRFNGEPYKGINVLALWGEAQRKGFNSPYWMTFKQAITLGGCVRKGEKGSPVVFAKTFSKTEQNDSGEEVEVKIPTLRHYSVFNADQIEGLPERFASAVEMVNISERIESVEQFFSALGVTIHHGGNSALYSPVLDRVKMPHFEAFKDAGSYYSTLSHECGHWTGNSKRLNRDFSSEKWGDEGYAREELVAELSAAFLCAGLGLPLEDREDHSAYIGSWLKVLKNDKKAIFTAAAHAQRAVEYLYSLQPQSEDIEEAA